ncbi:hypothetical protein FWK35_00019307 [Aphis craccivora]|uniref:Uncharacterized protein n=1 Tax=Aphis craccivora TaxID=307492 RepID=A0A6G0Z8U3_APHCR|nr:hypothetical protein FWK35_00019307 [Aphis craccivora]
MEVLPGSNRHETAFSLDRCLGCESFFTTEFLPTKVFPESSSQPLTSRFISTLLEAPCLAVSSCLHRFHDDEAAAAVAFGPVRLTPPTLARAPPAADPLQSNCCCCCGCCCRKGLCWPRRAHLSQHS